MVEPDSLDARLRFAIANRRLLELRYGGASRVAEPHDYGLLDDRERLLVYQLRGPSRNGRAVIGWRLLDVAKLESCTVLDATFAGSRGRSHHDHYEWKQLYVRVS